MIPELYLFIFGLGAGLFAVAFGYLADIQKSFPKQFNKPFFSVMLVLAGSSFIFAFFVQLITCADCSSDASNMVLWMIVSMAVMTGSICALYSMVNFKESITSERLFK